MLVQTQSILTPPLANINCPFPDKKPWNEFPLGVNTDGEEVVWDVTTSPHVLIAGVTGSGKSITQRTIILHALQNPSTMWQVIMCDPKRVEFLPYRGAQNVKRVASELEDIVFTIEDVESEMKNRYEMMEQEGVIRFFDLPTPPPALLLVISELYPILNPNSVETAPWREETKTALGNIARLGGRAGIHLVIATQRLHTELLTGETRANINARIAQAMMDENSSYQILGSDAATRLPAVAGWAIFQEGLVREKLQSYFMPSDKLERTVNICNALAAGYITPEDLTTTT